MQVISELIKWLFQGNHGNTGLKEELQMFLHFKTLSQVNKLNISEMFWLQKKTWIINDSEFICMPVEINLFRGGHFSIAVKRGYHGDQGQSCGEAHMWIFSFEPKK